MYINLDLTPEQEEKIKKSYNGYVDACIDNPEVMGKIFKGQFEGSIRSVINEFFQDKGIRESIKNKLTPVFIEQFKI